MNVLITVSIIAIIVVGSAVYVASTTDFLSILNVKTSAESEGNKKTDVSSFLPCPSGFSCVSDINSCYALCGTQSVVYGERPENLDVRTCNEKGWISCCECSSTSITKSSEPLIITALELQKAIDTSSEFKKLGKDAKFLISFFDGNGNPRSDLFFMVKENGKVTEGKEAYDVELQTGDYYIPQIKTTTDICSFIKRIKSMQEARVYLKIDALTAYSRYGGLGSCVPFS